MRRGGFTGDELSGGLGASRRGGDGEAPSNGNGQLWQAVFFISSVALLTLGFWVGTNGVPLAEKHLYAHLVAETPSEVVWIAQWANYLGDPRVLVPATGLLLLSLPATLRQRWWLWLGAMLTAPMLEGLAKEAVARPRPEALSAGFPSGHVTAVATLAVLLGYLGTKVLHARAARTAVWMFALLPIVAVAVARIVLRAHWPLDAVGGIVLGIVCASAAAWWNERVSGAAPSSEPALKRRVDPALDTAVEGPL